MLAALSLAPTDEKGEEGGKKERRPWCLLECCWISGVHHGPRFVGGMFLDGDRQGRVFRLNFPVCVRNGRSVGRIGASAAMTELVGE